MEERKRKNCDGKIFILELYLLLFYITLFNQNKNNICKKLRTQDGQPSRHVCKSFINFWKSVISSKKQVFSIVLFPPLIKFVSMEIHKNLYQFFACLPTPLKQVSRGSEYPQILHHFVSNSLLMISRFKKKDCVCLFIFM